MSFIMWSIHLMDLRRPVLQRYLQYLFLSVVLIFQEKNPWDERNSYLPIAGSFSLLFLSFVVRRRVPKYNFVQFRRGLLLLLCGVCCFVRGLDDDNDPFRFFHGCWHGFVGAAAYFNYKVLPSDSISRGGRVGRTRRSWPQFVYGSISHEDVKPNLEQQQQQQHQEPAMSIADQLYAYDLTWSTKIYQRFGRDPTPRLCWEIFSHTGDGFLWLLTIPPLMGLLWVAGLIGPFEPATKMLLSALFTCMTVDIIAIMLLKLVFHRQRPPFHTADMRFVGPDQHSFPSGHSTRVWCMVAMLFYLADTHPWILKEFFYGMVPAALVVLSVVWAMVINFSRVALGRHYPSDVLAGSLIGFFMFWPISLFFINHYSMLDIRPPPY
ncbi:hypothetical protein JM18_006534 [Phytophthora kernoviae]|uniref:Phosphatidic acid phosphatase type 2/haloperoxidase domain-containing protein n=2 Tax=Phytophthora kernoviae TaxID=325452 RepID=A0A8T0LS18_9STRA|nr:hypothetical protein G195_007466 [Phytophthora kernoviae 00238/432]KAG2520465.1 hypothetical protein JM16_006693 [Phytophthora kernoviae]KAG2521528.1 hypothetical protein JM18_006534 [Phytophthora kernoviae]